MNNWKSPWAAILIGVPGTGKSTWAQPLLEDAIHISTDKFIEEEAVRLSKSYRDIFYSTLKTATSSMNVEAIESIKEGKNIVWDQTNLTVKSRQRKLSQLPNGYYKVAVYFDISEEERARRVLKRKEETGKFIPDKVVESMTKSFEPPTKAEGFHEIIKITD